MIDLTADFEPGDDYGDGPYTHVEVQMVVRDSFDQKLLVIECQYGTKPASIFVPSSYPAKSVTIRSSDYDTVGALATVIATFGVEKRRCYEQGLIDLGIFSGTIE